MNDAIIHGIRIERDEARAHLALIIAAWDAGGSHAPYPIPRTALLEGLRAAIAAAREWVGTEQKIGKPPSSGPPYNSQGIPM